MTIDFNHIPNLCTFKKIDLLSGGISNQNYHIISRDPSKPDQLLTLFPDRKTWWKISKEKWILDIYKNNNIPSAQIISIGFAHGKLQTYRYILRNFIRSQDLHAFFLNNPFPNSASCISLLADLGNILGLMHSISMQGFGLLRNKSVSGSDSRLVPAASAWPTYIDNLMSARGKLASRIDKKKRFGSVTGLDIQNIFNASYAMFNNTKINLNTVTQPSFIHNDILFKNIIVDLDPSSSTWHVTAIIDNEWASSGDPDLDLIQLENCIYMSPAKETLLSHKHYFVEAYTKKRGFLKNVNKKRDIYHMMRSLFYLIAVYESRQSASFTIDSGAIKNIEANYIFLSALLKGKLPKISLFD